MAELSWKTNIALKSDLQKYVAQNLRRSEVLDFMKKDFPIYPWSLPTLDRRLRHFNIKYIDVTTPLERVIDAVNYEINGPGKLLGYRAMNNKLRIEHKIFVPRKLVTDVVWDLDPEGVISRNVTKKVKRAKKKPFVSEGPGWTFSLDGHDKLMGFQNSTFPIAVYGCLDSFSRRIMFLKVWDSNSSPLLIGKFYMEFILEAKDISYYLRLAR